MERQVPFLIWMRRSVALIGLIVSFGFCTGRAEAAGQVKWAEINPTMSDSEYVGDVKVCAKCHEDYIHTFEKTTHSKRFTTHPENSLQERYCEACHGPQSKHVQRPRVPEFRLSLKPDGPLTQKQRDSVCLQCHEKGERMHWQGSTHEMSEIGCSNCHYLSEPRSPKALLINKDPKMVCTQCHKDKAAQL
jgi:predicted CXXCH cytochrome family protein